MIGYAAGCGYLHGQILSAHIDFSKNRNIPDISASFMMKPFTMDEKTSMDLGLDDWFIDEHVNDFSDDEGDIIDMGTIDDENAEISLFTENEVKYDDTLSFDSSVLEKSEITPEENPDLEKDITAQNVEENALNVNVAEQEIEESCSDINANILTP